MKKITLIILCLFIPIKTSAQSSYKAMTLSSTQLNQDYNILINYLHDYHPDLYLYTKKEDFEELVSQTQAQLDQEKTDADFYRLLLPVIQAIRNNHTSVSPKAEMLAYLKTKALLFPYNLHAYSGAFYINQDLSEQDQSLEGMKVKAINGEAIENIIKKIVVLRPTDGFNSSSALNSATHRFSGYEALYFGFKKHYSIDYVDNKGQLKTTEVKPLTLNKIRENQNKRYNNTTDAQLDQYSLTINESKAILTIKTFLPTSERKFRSFLKNSFKQIKQQKVKNLIIDVQNNSGGYPESATELLSYLISEPIKPYKLAYALIDEIPEPNYFIKDNFYKHFSKQKLIEKKDGFFHLKGDSNIVIKPKKLHFTGDLTILINEGSASAAAEFIGLAKAYSQPIFIGKESGGNPVTMVATDIITLELPHSKLLVRFPLIKTQHNTNYENTGHGVMPDYEIQAKVSDLINGKNNALLKAIELIRKNPNQ